MSATTTVNKFQFINSDGPSLPQNVRTTIRKQAMKEIGQSRRRKTNYGQINRRQIPVFFTKESSGTSDDHGADLTATIPSWARVGSPQRDMPATQQSPVPPSASKTTHLTHMDDEVLGDETTINRAVGRLFDPTYLIWSYLLTLSDYERVRSKFGAQVSSLTLLTHCAISGNNKALASATGKLPCDWQQSYLDYIPAHYGRSECLTAATNVVLAKIQKMMSPNSSSTTECSRLYGIALHALQAAIGDEAMSKEADVLCATHLLTMHELLAPSADGAWSHHVKGTAQLFMHRSPSRFTTEFEKEMLVAHIPAIAHESFFANTHCYLEQPEWVALYLSLARDSESPYLTARSPLVINVRASVLGLPGLWHDVTKAVNRPDFLDRSASLDSLESRCRMARSDFLANIQAYEVHCRRLPSHFELPESESILRRDVNEISLVCHIIGNNLLATICEDERHELVAESQAVAKSILDSHKQLSSSLAWLFSGIQVAVAEGIVQCRAQWEEDVTNETLRSQKLASRIRHNDWSSTLQDADIWAKWRQVRGRGQDRGL